MTKPRGVRSGAPAGGTTVAGEVSEGMLFDIGYADGIRPALGMPERPVPKWGQGRLILGMRASAGRAGAMANAGPVAVDAYIARHSQGVRAILRRVRSIIRKALPGAEETISYQIPSYRLHGTYVIYFAGWKEHYSLYPVTERVVARLESQLRPYELSKGTVRFPLSQPVPAKLIERIAKYLGQEAADRAAANAAKAGKPRERRRRTTSGRG